MRARAAIACGPSAALALAAPGVAGAASPPFTYPEPPALESAAQLADAIDALHRANWKVYTDVERSDPAHRAEAQQLERFLLTPENEVRLEELSARARKPGEARRGAALRAILSDARLVLWQESYRWSLVEWRLALEERIAPHEQSVQRLADAAPIAERDGAVARIAAARASLNTGFAEAMSADTAGARDAAIERLTGSFATLLGVYNQERGALAVSLSSRRRAQGPEAPMRPREAPCPEAVARTSGHELPALAVNNLAPDSFYPQGSRHAQFEGMVTVEAWVSASGCMQQAAVYESSGVPELDEAAIRWTQQANFYPAERDHQAVDGTLRFRIRFQLTR